MRLEVPGRDTNTDGSPRTGPRPRVPLGTLLDTEIQLGPQSIIRYNLYPTAQIPGRAKQGVSSKDAINAMEEVAQRELPPTMGFEWTALSYQEKRALGQDINNLPADKVQRVLDIIAESGSQMLGEGAEEVEIDIEKLDTATLKSLQKYVREVLRTEKKKAIKDGVA